jgi:hypothetical protein
MFQVIHQPPRFSEDVIFSSNEYVEVMDHLKVEIEVVMDVGSDDLPHLNISWTPLHCADGQYYVTAMETYTFMNFRRYGWSWSPYKDAQRGFSGGVTYANGTDGGVECQDPKQVVRESLVRAMSEFYYETGAPAMVVYGDDNVRAAWFSLLSDALRNISDHAARCVGSTNGFVTDVKVSQR